MKKKQRIDEDEDLNEIEKIELRKLLKRETEKFLAKGGKITRCPTRTVYQYGNL